MNCGLLLAPSGWVVIKTAYSPGIIDSHTEDGKGFTMLVASIPLCDSMSPQDLYLAILNSYKEEPVHRDEVTEWVDRS